MKTRLVSLCAVCAATAAVAKTLVWEVSSPRPAVKEFAAYQGETVRFDMRYSGAMTNVAPGEIYYQTNGMGQAWWRADGLVFHPTNDVGAANYRLFVRSTDPEGVDYTASAILRMLPSPGFTPNALELPVKVLDFAEIEALNAPWPEEIASATNALSASLSSLVSLSSLAATNYTDSAIAGIAASIPEVAIPGTNAVLAGKAADARFVGIELAKTVTSVDGVTPDETGDVTLGAVFVGPNNEVDVGERKEGTATGDRSVVMGQNATASAANTVAEGSGTSATAQNAHAEGYGSAATNNNAHAEGWATTAGGHSSHAEGRGTKTLANYAHAEGQNTEAGGACAHAEGHTALAYGNYSHAEGAHTQTSNLYEHAQGNYNKSNPGTIDSIGIGDSTTRRNATEVMQDGKVYVYGVGGYDGTNPGAAQDVATATASAATAATNYTDSATNSLAVGLVEYIESPETVRTNYYTGVSRDTGLRDGKMILYHNQTQATAAWTLDLTLADGTKTGPKPVRMYGTTAATTYYGAHNIIKLVYRDGAWYASDYFVNNTNYYDRNQVTFVLLAEEITRNAICCGTTNGYRKVAAGVSFDLSYPLLYTIDTSTKAAGSKLNTYYSNFSTVDVRCTVSGFASRRGAALFLLGSIEGDTFTVGETPFSYEPVRPCIPLGWFNANADNSFCFLPGPVWREDVENLASDVEGLREEIAPAVAAYPRVYSFINGATNANFVVTNYQLTAEADAARTHFDQADPDLDFSAVPASLRLEDASSGTNRVVVDTRDWTVWYYAQKIGGAIHTAYTNAVETCRAWAGYTATGLENPVPDTLIVDVPNIWLMAGKTFEKHVAGTNSCWVIRSKDAVVPISDSSQSAGGFLELTDAFGEPYIRFNKTESYFVDPPSDGISFVDGEWQILYSTTNRPCGGANAVLQGSTTYPGKAVLKAEDDPDCPATITWTGEAGNWVMHAVPKSALGVVPPKIFFGAVVNVEGQDYIEYLRPMKIPHMLVDGVKIAPQVPQGSGVGATVTWEVVE